MKRSTTVGSRGSRLVAALMAGSLIIAACGGDDDGGSSEPAATEAPAPADSAAPAEPAPADSSAPADVAGPPTGPEMIVGMVNTEGTPGLDFPDMRRFAEAAFEYMNTSGGFGNRPVKFESCVAKGSPETSQACAQELVGKGVELVLVGLDLFPDYKTYEAAGVPVIGILPILPGDYTANALYLSGGTATSVGQMATVAKEKFNATSVGIVSADNAGANQVAAGLEAALTKAGITFKTVKGGDNETDAGYQGLMREASKDNPDLLISLYSDAGCIGTMRGYATLGLDVPVLTTGICSDEDVISVVGDEATNWYFQGVAQDRDTPERAELRRVLAPVIGVAEDEVKSSGLGLGGLGYILVMSLRDYANQMVAAGTEMTGSNLFDFLKNTQGLFLFGGETPIECGAVPTYSSVCAFISPWSYYAGDGVVAPLEEPFYLVDSKKYLP